MQKFDEFWKQHDWPEELRIMAAAIWFEASGQMMDDKAGCIESRSSWVSVKERLPEMDVPVLTVQKSGYDGKLYVGALCRTDGGEGWLWAGATYSHDLGDKSNYEDADDYEPLYWQPLPLPPVEAGNGKR